MDIRTVAIAAVAVAACVWDLRTRRVPNELTFGTAAAGVIFALSHHGLAGMGWSIAGCVTAIALFFPFFALGGLGAGDVKLLGAFGAWLGGVSASLYLACFTALAGGVMALIVMLSRGYLQQGFRNLTTLMVFWATSGVRPLPDLTLERSRGPKLAYALPIAVGALTTLWLQ